MITSTSNPEIKYIRSLHLKKNRESERRFVVEGRHLLEEAIASGWLPVIVAYEPRAVERSSLLQDALDLVKTSADLIAVDEKVMESISETTTPQGVVAVIPVQPVPPLPTNGLALVLDQVRDPGNTGTIMRAAEASGSAGVVLSQGSADPFNGKCLRAAAGAHFRLPFLADQDWPAIGRLLQGRLIFLAEAEGGQPHYEVDWTQPSAVIFCNEAHGPGPESIAFADGRVSIPMRGKAESLNVAMAATVIAFEAERQLEIKAGTKRVSRTKPSGKEGR